MTAPWMPSMPPQPSMPSQPLVLRNARLPGATAPVDVVLADGRIRTVAHPGEMLPAARAADVVDLDGRHLIPGLWDSHVHFTQWVKARRRIDLSAAADADQALEVVGRALVERPGDSALIGYGFRDGLWPSPPTLAALDALSPDRPVVLVSGDLHCGWVNSTAARILDVRPDQYGLVREAEWIGADHRSMIEDDPGIADFREAARAAAARGVVGVVDFECADNVQEWPARVAAGVDTLRVQASIWPDRLQAAVAAGLRTGETLDPAGLITVGPLKVVVDGSLNTRTALCHDPYPGLGPEHPHPCGVRSVSPEQLRDLLATAYGNGVEAAVHAIGDQANQQVIDEFERLGRGGTIEHAQLVADADFARFGRLGLIASVQPEHAMDDRDVADRYWNGRTARAFAFRSLHEAGARLRLGSDAPVAPLDPWLAVAAAVGRTRDGRQPWHPEQAVPLSLALAASVRTRLAPGEPADLVVLEEDPDTLSVEALRQMPVTATLLGGRWTWNNL